MLNVSFMRALIRLITFDVTLIIGIVVVRVVYSFLSSSLALDIFYKHMSASVCATKEALIYSTTAGVTVFCPT